MLRCFCQAFYCGNILYRSAGIELEETVYLFDGSGRETFVVDHMPLKEVMPFFR